MDERGGIKLDRSKGKCKTGKKSRPENAHDTEKKRGKREIRKGDQMCFMSLKTYPKKLSSHLILVHDTFGKKPKNL